MVLPCNRPRALKSASSLIADLQPMVDPVDPLNGVHAVELYLFCREKPPVISFVFARFTVIRDVSGKQKSAPESYPLNWRPWRARKRKDNNRHADGTNHLRNPSNSVLFQKPPSFQLNFICVSAQKAICLAGCPPLPRHFDNTIALSKHGNYTKIR